MKKLKVITCILMIGSMLLGTTACSQKTELSSNVEEKGEKIEAVENESLTDVEVLDQYLSNVNEFDEESFWKTCFLYAFADHIQSYDQEIIDLFCEMCDVDNGNFSSDIVALWVDEGLDLWNNGDDFCYTWEILDDYAIDMDQDDVSSIENYFKEHNIIIDYIPDADLSSGIDALRLIPVKFESYDSLETEYITFTLASYKSNWYILRDEAILGFDFFYDFVDDSTISDYLYSIENDISESISDDLINSTYQKANYKEVDSYIDYYFIENFPLTESFDSWKAWLDINGYTYEIDSANYNIVITSGAKNDWYMGVYYNTTDQDWNSITWEVQVEESSCQAVYDACREELIDYYGNPIFEPGKASWFSNGTYGIGVLNSNDQCIQIQVCPEYVNIGNQ